MKNEKQCAIHDVIGGNLTELPSAGRVIITNHNSIPNGNYIFFKGPSGNYFVTLSYQDRHSTYRIGELTLKNILVKLLPMTVCV